MCPGVSACIWLCQKPRVKPFVIIYPPWELLPKQRNMAILPGARSLLVSEKLRAMTDKDDILNALFPRYVSLISCVLTCLSVLPCSPVFLFSFFYDGMTERKYKQDKYKRYRGFSGIRRQSCHASFHRLFTGPPAE